ncbi:MAG: hypothetical protein HZB71_02910 [Betaproteobacteria bacterium]|nr:hypothetical protein [Betaproteobacteria bacterium]
MSLNNKEEMLSDIEAAVADDEGLRERVRGLVVRALTQRALDPEGMREVMRLTLEGVGAGLARRGTDAGGALKEAVQGMDEAVARSVYAVQMALEESWGSTRRFAETDLKATAEAVKGLENDLLGTLRDSAAQSQGWLRNELTSLSEHMGRAGTDTGMQVRGVMEKMNSRLLSASLGAMADARKDAVQLTSRLSEMASGILRGMADVLDAQFRK